MIDTDVLMQKINSIQNCLKRIDETVNNDVERLKLLDVQDVVVLNLQRAIQLVIDSAFHVALSENLGISSSLKEVFKLLKDAEIIDATLSHQMQKMVGFRNIAVYDYQIIDQNILQSIVEHHLKDIESFYTTISNRYFSSKWSSHLGTISSVKFNFRLTKR